MAYITVTTAADMVDARRRQAEPARGGGRGQCQRGRRYHRLRRRHRGHDLTLTQGELVLSQDLTIDGADNGAAVTIDGSDQGRILHIVGGGTDVVLTGLTLANGNSGNAAGNGGAVLLGGGGLVMNAVTVRDSHCGSSGYYGNGGGLFAEPGSRVAVNHSLIQRNTAYNGGGIATGAAVVLSIRSSRISDNATPACGAGGGISVTAGSVLTIDASEIADNWADSLLHILWRRHRFQGQPSIHQQIDAIGKLR